MIMICAGTDYPIPPFVPGGGGPNLRRSLGVLQQTLDSLPLQYLYPVRNLVSGIECNGRPQMVMQYAVIGNVTDGLGLIAFYLTSAWWANGTLNGTYTIEFAVPPPSTNQSATGWHVAFIDPVLGGTTASAPVVADAWNRLSVTTPPFVRDVAFMLSRDDSAQDGAGRPRGLQQLGRR